MFRHVVMWRLDSDDDARRAEMAQRIVDAMAPLPAAIPGIRRMRLDVNEIFPDENADLVLTMDFEDRQSFEAYRHHPAHVAVSPVIAGLYRTRLAVDFEYQS